MKSYEELLSWTYDLQKFGIKLGLSSTENLLHRLGNPHKELKTIHIGGTNGKGSTAAMLLEILTAMGYNVGFYSSPHLVDFEERFRIGQENISRDRVTDLMHRVKAVIDDREPPTYFEFTTAMAFLYFFEQKTDIAIMEVGLGGRLDATNVVHPMVTVITNISKEHEQYLGNTIESIAFEKAGIIKPSIPLVSAAKQPEVVRLFEETCATKGSPFHLLERDFAVKREDGGLTFEGFGHRLTGLQLNLEGPVQRQNLGVALGALSCLEPHGIVFDQNAIRQGISQTAWPGRFQRISEDPVTIVDGAHNPAAMGALHDSLVDRFPGKKIVLVLGIMADKDIAAMTNAILPAAHEVICSRPVYSRAAEPEQVHQYVRSLNSGASIVPNLPEAIERAQNRARELDGIAVIAGSLFTVGEALEYVRDKEAHSVTLKSKEHMKR